MHRLPDSHHKPGARGLLAYHAGSSAYQLKHGAPGLTGRTGACSTTPSSLAAARSSAYRCA